MNRRRSTYNAIKYTAAVVLLLISIFPYIYMVLQSLAPWDQVNKVFIPSRLTLRSYIWLFTGTEALVAKPWLRAFLNSVIVSVSSTTLMVLSAAIIGYALAKLPFRGGRLVYDFILFQMFYPAVILLIPTFLLVKAFGWFNTYWAMIVPKAMSVWAIFMYTSFFKSVPQEIIDSARVDGASEWRIIFRIMIPLSKSITIIVALFLFMARWEELLWDLVVVQDTSMRTLNVLLATIQSSYNPYPGPLYAAATILTLPILLVFLAFSRHFSQGIRLVLGK
jgi:multiple sugar transport system permease protein